MSRVFVFVDSEGDFAFTSESRIAAGVAAVAVYRAAILSKYSTPAAWFDAQTARFLRIGCGVYTDKVVPAEYKMHSTFVSRLDFDKITAASKVKAQTGG